MKHVVSAGEMKKCDSHMIREVGVPSLVLMERAADACVRETLNRYPDSARKDIRFLCVCGSGNNGGDGFAAARILTVKGYSADIWLVGNPGHMTPETKTQSEICQRLGIRIFTDPAPDPASYAVIFDAIFGIGLSRNVEGRYEEVIRQINEAHKVGSFVTAVDIASGVAADTGEVMGCAVRADLTVTMQFLKPGLLLPPGSICSGEVVDAEIGICYQKTEHPIFLPEAEDLKELLPERSRYGNKGTFGKVLIVSGSENMAGASLLASEAALRSGAGMVKLLTVAENRVIVQETVPEVMLSVYHTSSEAVDALKADLLWCTAVAAGSGMGNTKHTFEIVSWLLANCEKPLVLDADALNVLDGRTELLDQHKSSLTITPHMGEMSRLSGISVPELKKDPIRYAREFSMRHHLTCILKDARTITALEDGTCYLNDYGNDGMATAGSGDTLTGITVSLTAQNAPAYAAVLLHALAGDAAAGKKGKPALIARDIIAGISDIYTE